MCLTIVKPAGVEVSEGLLRTAFDRNQDGWGIMRIARKGPLIKKGLGQFPSGKKGNFEEFWKNYQHFKDYNCAIHFRASSAGKVDIDNVHPFHIPNTTAWVMHNGTFGDMPIINYDRSDTWHFAQMLGNAYAKVLFTPEFIRKLEERTKTQRLVFMDLDKGFIVLNKDLWLEEPGTGILYSNMYSFDPTRELLVHNYGEEIVSAWEEREKKANAPASTGEKDDLVYQTRQEYIQLWQNLLEKKVSDVALQEDMKSAERFYDRETESVNRDACIDVSSDELAAGIEIANLGRDELRQLCYYDPVVLSKVIYRTLQRL